MKNKKIIGLSIIGILSTSSIAFANDIKVLTKDNVKYIPLKKVIQKSGGKVDMSDDTAKITIDGKNIVIEKNLSFAKLNNNYYPLNKKRMNGIEVPVDTKPIFEKDEVYIEKDFLKDNKIANYKIEKDNVKVILEDKDKPTPTQKVENIKEENKNEKKDSQVNHEINDNSNGSNNISRPTVSEKPSRPTRPTKPNRPNTGGNSSNSNNNSNSESNNNSGGIVDNSGSNTGGNTGGENNSGSENNGNQTPGQSTPEAPNDQPSTGTVE